MAIMRTTSTWNSPISVGGVHIKRPGLQSSNLRGCLSCSRLHDVGQTRPWELLILHNERSSHHSPSKPKRNQPWFEVSMVNFEGDFVGAVVAERQRVSRAYKPCRKGCLVRLGARVDGNEDANWLVRDESVGRSRLVIVSSEIHRSSVDNRDFFEGVWSPICRVADTRLEFS